MFFMFFIFYVFLYFFKFRVSVVVKTKNVQNNKYYAFLMVKTPFPGHSECFVAVLLTSCQKSCRILDVFRPPKF